MKTVIHPTAHSVAGRQLGGPHVCLWPGVDAALLERMIASLGQGPDHLVGEEVVALVVERNTQSALAWVNPIRAGVHAAMAPKHVLDKGALLTDARIILRDVTERVAIDYDQIQSASVPGGFGGLFLDYLKIVTPATSEKYTCGSHGQLALALTDLAHRARNGSLAQPRVAAPTATPDDPSGARTFSAARRANDERAAFLLKGVAFGLESGTLHPGSSLDMARRVALLHRTTVGGRGSHQGMWISPLRPDELKGFFSSRYGAPAPQAPLHGFETILYSRDAAAAAAAPGSGIGLRVPGKSSQWLAEKQLRLRLQELTHPAAGRYTAYLVEAQGWGEWESLTGVHDAQLYNLHLELLAFEAQMLLRRLLFGYDRDATALLAYPDDETDAKLAQVNAAVDAGAFRVPRAFQRLDQIAHAPAATTLAGASGGHAAAQASSAPGSITATLWINLVAGMLSLTVCSCLWCLFGSSGQDGIEASINIPFGDDIDVDRTMRAYTGVVVGQTVLQWILGAVRIVLAGLVVTRGRRKVALALVGLGAAGFLAGDTAGVLASLLTVWCMTRPAARDWLAG